MLLDRKLSKAENCRKVGNIDEAIQIINKIKPNKTYLTHISHNMGFHDEVSKKLPENVYLSYDGLEIDVN